MLRCVLAVLMLGACIAVVAPPAEGETMPDPPRVEDDARDSTESNAAATGPFVEPERERCFERPHACALPLFSLGGGLAFGSRIGERVGLVGGDFRGGVGLLAGNGYVAERYFVALPTIGVAGWRTLDERPSRFDAYTFIGRLDVGYLGYHTKLAPTGFTVWGAGLVGGGRSVERDQGLSLLDAVRLGAVVWPFSTWVGLEFQSQFTHHRGEWRSDLRAGVTINLLSSLVDLVFMMGAM
jgi:hypothetical protein